MNDIATAQKIVDNARAKSRLPRYKITIIEKNEIGWKFEMNGSIFQMKSTWEPAMAVRISEAASIVAK